MAPRKNPPKKEPVLIRSHTLTPSTETILKRLSGDATDTIGRAVSDSAIVRALLRYADQQGMSWVRACLFPFAEEEIVQGMMWGKKKS
jgi:hypothetical protein